MSDRAALVEAARVSIEKGSKSFALASKLFDPQTRERAWLLYAWCRRCDDIADGQEHGGALTNNGDPAARLAQIRMLTRQAYDELPTGDLVFDAFGLVARECHIPYHYADDLIEGFALDSAGWRPRTTSDLLRYCYHVAGVVGIMMALVMGVPPEDDATLGRACDLGYAFQLANIARDVREDAEAGRCYLPQDWLDEVGLDAAERSAQLATLIQRLATMAAGYEASARIGARKLPFRSRWAVLAAAAARALTTQPSLAALEVTTRVSHAA